MPFHCGAVAAFQLVGLPVAFAFREELVERSDGAEPGRVEKRFSAEKILVRAIQCGIHEGYSLRKCGERRTVARRCFPNAEFPQGDSDALDTSQFDFCYQASCSKIESLVMHSARPGLR